MGIKLPINVEHRDHIEVDRPEHLERIRTLEDQAEEAMREIAEYSARLIVAQKQIEALESVRLAAPQVAKNQEQKAKTEIIYKDKIVERVVEVEKLMPVIQPDKQRERFIAMCVSLFWIILLLIMASMKG